MFFFVEHGTLDHDIRVIGEGHVNVHMLQSADGVPQCITTGVIPSEVVAEGQIQPSAHEGRIALDDHV